MDLKTIWQIIVMKSPPTTLGYPMHYNNNAEEDLVMGIYVITMPVLRCDFPQKMGERASFGGLARYC